MLEDLYAKPDLSKKVPAQPQETEKDADHDDRNTPIYDNNVSQRSTEDVVEEPQTATSVREGSGTSVKVLLGLLCLVLLAAVVVMVTFLFEWRRDNSSQQEEPLRSLGEMRGNLSQLMDNFSNLTKKVEQYKTEMDAIASNLAPTTQNLSEKCPAGWRRFQRSCYLQCTSALNWTDSRKFCQEHGADLVIISDLHEQFFVMSFDVSVWIGVTAHKEGSSLTWRGVNNQELTTTFWSAGEPNQTPPNEDCVALQQTPSPRWVYNWNDAVCSVPQSCVCEKIMKA